MKHHVGSLCICMICLSNLFLAGRPSKQELYGMEARGKGPGEVDYHDLLHQQVALYFLHVTSIFSLFSFSSFWMFPSPHFSPEGTYRTSTRMSAFRPGLLLPTPSPFPKLAFLRSPLLTRAKNTAKRHGMTARVPNTQNIQRIQKSPGVKIMTNSKIFI